MNTPKPPGPNPQTNNRWSHQALRYRLLSGRWQGDLEQALKEVLPADRRAVWASVDMSSNIFKASCQALAALYDSAPTVSHTQNIDQLTGRDQLLDRAGLFPMLSQLQYLTIGLNECLLKIDIAADGQNLCYRIVTPDTVYAEQPPGYREPNFLYELRLRKGKDKVIWTADVFDLRDPANPSFKIKAVSSSGELTTDLTEMYTGQTFEGPEYPYRDQQGQPFLPYALYHSKLHGDLWDPYHNAECAQGAICAATQMCFYQHIILDASWPQRYVAGLTLPVGAYDTDSSARRTAIATDPASILCFVPDPSSEGMGQQLVGQFQAGGDPETVLNSIVIYERRLAQQMGISSGDVTRLSGDPRSGFSLSISRESTRENQRKQSTAARYGDLQTLEKSAKMANRFLGASLPESGYSIEYTAIPLGPTELQAQREDLIAKLQNGLIDPVSAILTLHPDWDAETAINYLSSIEEGRKRFPFMYQQPQQTQGF